MDFLRFLNWQLDLPYKFRIRFLLDMERGCFTFVCKSRLFCKGDIPTFFGSGVFYTANPSLFTNARWEVDPQDLIRYHAIPMVKVHG